MSSLPLVALESNKNAWDRVMVFVLVTVSVLCVS